VYLTAQRVQAVRGPPRGVINAFLYRPPAAGDAVDWENPDFDELTRSPGTLVRQSTPLQPGGNRVLSFLDVLAPDAVTEQELTDALLRIAETLPPAAGHWRGRSDRVSTRFFAPHSNGHPRDEFTELLNTLLRLFAAPVSASTLG
jgi:hypothetical protein